MRINGRALAALIPALVVWPAVLLACGPFFPNRILVGSDAVVLSAPKACFANELQRLLPKEKLPFRALPPESGDYERQTIEADVKDLISALKDGRTPQDKLEGIVRNYRAMCQSLRPAASRNGANQQGAAEAPSLKPLSEVDIPAGLPAEFAEYARGAIAWRKGDSQEARIIWEKLLERPAAERRYRSTWAAFMLGKSWLNADDAKAAAWFERIRGLPADGFHDSLGLASASLGWQARAELNAKHYDVAIEFYIEHYATGDATAISSLQWAIHDLLAADAETIAKAAELDFIRPAVTAYVISREGWRWDEGLSKQAHAWLSATERVAARGMEGADRLGLIAYQLGDFEATERWLRRATGSSPLAKWLRAKLLMREGRLDGAALLLSQAARSFPPEELWSDTNGWSEHGEYSGTPMPASRQVQGEIGALQLARRHYLEALDALVKGNFRQDAAYVAERVLHTGELLAYVERNCPEETKPDDEDPKIGGEPIRAWLRRVLAKRLAREGKLAEAGRYFPGKLRVKLDAYSASLGKGRDQNLSAADRAAALWSASQFARSAGLAIMGTEVEPDWAIEGGSYELPAYTIDRAKESDAKICAANEDEQKRTGAHAVSPEKRFHYRYVAADLAWEAASLMPDNSADTARVLWTAGGWLKDRDPKEADRFYKALVNRCRKTDLGREADGLRWFPKAIPGSAQAQQQQ